MVGVNATTTATIAGMTDAMITATGTTTNTVIRTAATVGRRNPAASTTDIRRHGGFEQACGAAATWQRPRKLDHQLSLRVIASQTPALLTL